MFVILQWSNIYSDIIRIGTAQRYSETEGFRIMWFGRNSERVFFIFGRISYIIIKIHPESRFFWKNPLQGGLLGRKSDLHTFMLRFCISDGGVNTMYIPNTDCLSARLYAHFYDYNKEHLLQTAPEGPHLHLCNKNNLQALLSSYMNSNVEL